MPGPLSDLDGRVRGMTQPLPARAWKLGDIVLPAAGGSPRRVTLHRMEGAPPQVVVQYAGEVEPHRYRLDHTETVAR